MESYKQFCKAATVKDITQNFQSLCNELGEHPKAHEIFYKRLKPKLARGKALWSQLDARAADPEYNQGTCCLRTKVLIIGGGPCGLRTAIEVVLLGGRAVVVEKREHFSRNNVVHLWSYVVDELKAIGVKTLCPTFGNGSIHHISIRALQNVLMKIALLVGVEIHTGVTFEDIREPPGTTSKVGWTARLSPSSHRVNEYEFDVIIGADGNGRSLKEFPRTQFRATSAIAITANFVRRKNREENAITSNRGKSCIYADSFFKELKEKMMIDLENIVYYKDDTNYFIMTAKKQSLMDSQVFKENINNGAQLLHATNINQECLLKYVVTAVTYYTENQLKNLELVRGENGKPDISIFDFTSISSAKQSSRVIHRNGHDLLVGLAGDSLTESFWPQGTGIGLGFLSVFDAAWMIRNWASGKMTPEEVVTERESIYRKLSQVKAEHLMKKKYTINPETRYKGYKLPTYLKRAQVQGQYDAQDVASRDQTCRREANPREQAPKVDTPPGSERRDVVSSPGPEMKVKPLYFRRDVTVQTDSPNLANCSRKRNWCSELLCRRGDSKRFCCPCTKKDEEDVSSDM